MTGSSDKPLQILLLTDGRPGHFNLSEGIVAAIGRLREVEVNRVEVRRPAWLPARVLSSLVNTGMPAERILRLVYRVDPQSLGHVDVIVSAGGNTLAANVAASEITGAENIFYGSLRRYQPEDFSLVMTSYAEDATAPNRLMWLKPSKFDPDEFVTIAAAKISRESPGTLGLIIGGDSGTVHFSPEDWDHLISLVNSSHDAFGTRWIVANSPRTPSAVSDRLDALARNENSPVELFIDVRTAGPGTLGTLLSGSEGVVCTADSSSMLSECIWMRRPVVAVEPQSFKLPDNEMSYRNWLEEQGWVSRLQLSELDAESVVEAMGEVRAMEQNPLDALAAELQSRLAVLAD